MGNMSITPPIARPFAREGERAGFAKRLHAHRVGARRSHRYRCSFPCSQGGTVALC
jgi:hypothetical protein